jgi:hypothetical protein
MMMTRTLCLASALMLAALPVSAQRPAAQPVSLAAGLQRSYATVKQNLTEMAAKMAESDYGFKPTPEVRSFGQLFGHVANSAYNRCAAARGVANPNQGTNNEDKTTKADVQKALADSFAFCDAAYEALTDASAAEMVTMGRGQQARGSILADNIAHDNEMYGTGVVYMRLKGLVPPSTERRTRKPGQ